MKTRSLTPLITLTCIGLLHTTNDCKAALAVYEGFQYESAFASVNDYSGNSGVIDQSLVGESDGDPGDVDATGLAGTWAESTLADDDDWFKIQGSLALGDLATSGNRVGYNSLLDSSGASRSINAAGQSVLDGGSEMWFSILANPTEKASASRGGFVIASSTINAGAIENTAGTDVSAAIGFGSPGSHNWRAYTWDGTTRQSSTALNTTLNQTYLMVGQLSYNTGAGGADEFSLYQYILNAGSVTGGSLSQIGSTLLVDIDETTLDVINLNRQRYWEADEIRIGTSLSDVVVAVPEPSTALLGGLGTLLMLRRRRS